LDDTNEIQGYLGVVSYPFLIYDSIIEAAGLAMWVVDESLKNSGIGMYLRKAVEDRFDIVYVIGINHNVVRYYQRRTYSYYNSLNRYILPLDAENYKHFFVDSDEVAVGKIKSWSDSICYRNSASPLTNLDTSLLAKKYTENVAPYFTLRPNKDVAFWEWRYIKSKGFKYLFYEREGNIVIFRIENTYSPSNLLLHGKKCLRVIEILPNDGKVWNGNSDENLAETLCKVLTWAKEQGCVLADFQISNSKLSHILKDVGFRLQSEDSITNVAHLFSPFRLNAPPLNFAYRINYQGNGFLNIDREETYLLKSDGDMDRPNYLG